MSGISLFVEQTVFGLAPPDIKLPQPFKGIFNVMHVVHKFVRAKKKVEIYTNPHNFLQLAGGHLLNFMLGDQLFVRIVAQTVLIATRILESVEAAGAAHRSLKKVKKAVYNPYVLPAKIKWETKVRSSVLSPATLHKIRDHMQRAWDHLKRIASAVVTFVKKLFSLSMRIMDAIESFSMSPATTNEAVNEVFVNATKWLDKLVENKDMLLGALEENKVVVAKILNHIGFNYSVEQIVDKLTNAMDTAEGVYKGIKKVTDVIAKGFWEVFKHSAFGFMAGLGLAKYVPDTWLPSKELCFGDKKLEIPKEKYPPLEWVKLGSDLTPIIEVKDAKPTEAFTIVPEEELLVHTKKLLDTEIHTPAEPSALVI